MLWGQGKEAKAWGRRDEDGREGEEEEREEGTTAEDRGEAATIDCRPGPMVQPLLPCRCLPPPPILSLPDSVSLPPGRLWGEGAIWLHVEHDNDSALSLYTGEGFRFHSTDPWWRVGKRRLLLWKPLPTPKVPGGDRTSVSGTTGADGVYQWSLRPGDGNGEATKEDEVKGTSGDS